MNDEQLKQVMHSRNYGCTIGAIPTCTIVTLMQEVCRLNDQGLIRELQGVFNIPNRSSVDNAMNNHRTLYGTDNPHARLISKIRMALQNLPVSRQEEYLRSMKLIP